MRLRDILLLDQPEHIGVDLFARELARLEVVVVPDKLPESVFVGLNGAPTVALQHKALLQSRHRLLIPGRGDFLRRGIP